jgi:hypothetical protein
MNTPSVTMTSVTNVTSGTNAEILSQATKIKQKYPDFCTIYCVSHDFPLPKNKYLIKKDMTFGQLIYIIRKKLALKEEEGIFFLIKSPKDGEIVAKTSDIVGTLYNDHCDPEIGCLYITILKENVFGA